LIFADIVLPIGVRVPRPPQDPAQRRAPATEFVPRRHQEKPETSGTHVPVHGKQRIRPGRDGRQDPVDLGIRLIEVVRRPARRRKPLRRRSAATRPPHVADHPRPLERHAAVAARDLTREGSHRCRGRKVIHWRVGPLMVRCDAGKLLVNADAKVATAEMAMSLAGVTSLDASALLLPASTASPQGCAAGWGGTGASYRL
jgi:hypothetical protein